MKRDITKKNISNLARKIAINEAGRKQVSIAQIKEVIRILAIILASDGEYLKLFLAYGRKLLGKRAA